MYFAYRGINVLVLAPLLALFAVLWHESAPLMGTYTQIYMPALGGYLLKYFPLFLLGAIFGKLMNDSGAASAIGKYISNKIGAQNSILAIVLSCAILTYGGVSLFVVAFCIYPIANTLFKEANTPKRLIPGAIALGSFTFTMTALPGTPSIQNAIPMPFYGTNLFAAPGLGIIGATIMFFGGLFWLLRRSKKAQLNGEGYDDSAHDIEAKTKTETPTNTPPFWLAIIPLIMVIVLNFVLSKYVLPHFDHSYLQETKFGNTSASKLIGLWSLIIALCLSIAAIIALMRKNLRSPVSSINAGTFESLLPIFNTASEVGYGATIASLSSFAAIKQSILSITPDLPLISQAISINALAGITGSASGGLSIALEALSENYINLANKAGISLDLLHRVATMSCGGFDTLPHNGAVITLLTICGMTHKKSYFDIFIVAVVTPFIATCVVVALGTFIGSF